MRTTAATIGASTILLLGLTACGSNDDQSQTEKWADGFCSSASTWKDAMGKVGDDLKNPSSLSADSLKSTLTGAADATQTFADDLKGLGSPGTEAGDEAKSQISTLADELAAQRKVISDAVASAPSDVAGMVGTLATVTTALSTMASDLGTTFTTLDGLDGSDELKQAFKDSSQCQDLQSE